MVQGDAVSPAPATVEGAWQLFTEGRVRGREVLWPVAEKVPVTVAQLPRLLWA